MQSRSGGVGEHYHVGGGFPCVGRKDSTKDCGHGVYLSSFLPKNHYKDKGKKKKLVDMETNSEVNVNKLLGFLKDSKPVKGDNTQHGGLQTKQKIADMDCYLLRGEPRNGAHLPQMVVVHGPERRALKTMVRRMNDNPNRLFHLRKAQSTWRGWSGSWGSSGWLSTGWSGW